MVKYNTTYSDEQMDVIFHSLADPTRRKILERLSHGDLTVTEIAKPYDISLPAISKHIRVLHDAKLITKEKNGREYTIRLEPKTLQTAEEYIAFYKKFWNKQLDNLEKFLQDGGKHGK